MHQNEETRSPHYTTGLSSDATLTLKNNDITTLEEEDWLHIFQQLYPDGAIDLAGTYNTAAPIVIVFGVT